ncbi:MAG TPA: helix-turn-helix domain-containing protein [Spirochaetota bacterium]|nr:helix-turn-helix domain-containing protein [Spirochaetota bacterium]HPR49637.1 helix-turn-helix domain-containing protein [Spirochaetota bacterium]
MNLYSLPTVVMAGICFYVGFYYLWTYLRRRFDHANLFFALSCFSIAAYDVFCAGLYNSPSPEQGMMWQRWQFASLALFTVCTSWFVFFFTHFRYRLPLIIITLWHALLFIAGLAVRNDLTLSLNNPKPKHVELFNLISVTYNEVDPGLIYGVQYISMLLAAVFIMVILIDYYINDEQRHARPLLLSMSTFFIAAFNDAFVGMALYSFIFLLEYAYLFIIFSMAYVLQSRFIDLHHEVEELNVQLEEKINERTMELFFSEIGVKLYSDICRDLSTEPGKKTPASLKKINGEKTAPSLDKISSDISIIANIDGLLSRSLLKAMEISTAQSGYIFIVNEAKELEIRASKVISSRAISLCKKRIVEQVFSDGNFIITDVVPGDAIPERKGESGDTIDHVLSIPIMNRDIILGVCHLENYDPQKKFTEKDANLILAFMDQVAIAIENSFLYKKMKTDQEYTRRPSITPAIEEKIKQAMAYLTDNYTSNISREGLAASLNMHPDSLGRFFKMYTGKRINEFINDIRIQDAADRIADTDKSIIDIAFEVGFESLTTFNRAFLKVMKITPSEHREKSGKL